MRHFIFILTISLFVTSCDQNDTKQKELELKEKELALKEKELQLKEKETSLPTKDTSSVTQQPIQKSKEQLWDEYWTQFSKAVNQKDKTSMIELSLKGEAFFDGGGGSTASQWINSANNETWQYWQKAVNKGVKAFEKTKKITKDEYMIFEFKNGKWVWTGVMGD